MGASCIPILHHGQHRWAAVYRRGEDETSLIYSKIGAALAKGQDAIAFQIFDQKAVRYLELRYLSHGTGIEADTITGLAERLGIDPLRLSKTVEDFNNAVPDEGCPFHPHQKDGRCTQERLSPRKSHWAQRIDAPPFVGYAGGASLIRSAVYARIAGAHAAGRAEQKDVTARL